LSEDHVTWSIINEVAAATADHGVPARPGTEARDSDAARLSDRQIDARRTILNRRSAVAFDGTTSIARDVALRLFSALQATTGVPFDALWWSPRIHLFVFIHRVDGLDPGLYFLPRHPHVVDRLKAACSPSFAWDEVARTPLLFRLASGDSRAISQRLSCDQSIAGDGMFCVAMLADFDASLDEFGPSFYRHLFWEAGLIGQAAYLGAEAAGIRGTGIGCFYDDAVHELLGLKGHGFQSLYHFTVGMAVDDVRLTTEAAYEWER
jgi:hypothetical protein